MSFESGVTVTVLPLVLFILFFVKWTAGLYCCYSDKMDYWLTSHICWCTSMLSHLFNTTLALMLTLHIPPQAVWTRTDNLIHRLQSHSNKPHRERVCVLDRRWKQTGISTWCSIKAKPQCLQTTNVSPKSFTEAYTVYRARILIIFWNEMFRAMMDV